MFDYLRFFRAHVRPVIFGASLTCNSGFGQTFLVSLFIPFLHSELQLSNTAFGAIYSAATLVSATLLVKAGKSIDTESLDRYTKKAELILFASTLLLAATVHPAMLFIAMFGVRFAGQGLMSHISQTVMARHFERSRGKALGIASLGYSAAELVMPIVLTFAFPLIGWRLSLASLAVLALVLMLALLASMPLRSFERVNPDDRFEDEDAASSPPSGAKFDTLRDRTFWFLAAPGWVFTVAATGYFFYQMVMVKGKGWDPKWYALVFTVYAVTRIVSTFGTGALVDRFGARFVYPLHFAPFIAGCLVMGFSGGAAALVFFLVGMGLTMGASSVLQSAVLAETYGADIVGTVRSVFAAAMIFGSSLGPAGFGIALDAGVSMEGILAAIGILTLAGVAASLPTWKRPRARKMAA